MDSTSGDCGVEYSNPKSATDLVVSSTSYTAPITEGSSPVLSLRYESQKRRDWKTFLQYLENNKPPLTLASCTASHVIEFLKHLDQFGKTKMHLSVCANFGHRNSPTPCTCPLQQAWGSLDALIGRLRAAYEENGGDPDLNPFGSRAVRLYLKELREVQAKARGITYLKKRKRPTTTSIPTSVAEITQMVHGSVGGGGVSTFVAGGFVTSMKQTAQVVGGNSCNGGGDGGYSCDVNGVVTSMTGITRVVDASRDSGGGSTSDAGGVVTSMTRTTQAIDGSAGACGDSTSDAGGVATSIAGTTQAIDRSTGGCGDSTSDAGGVVTSIAGITHVVDGCSTSTSGLCVTSSDEINQLVDGVIASGGGGSTSDAGGVVNDEKWMTPKFIPGTLVEVNLPDKQCHEAWVPAKILNAGFSQSLFLVGYNNSRLGYEEWCSKATVNALHIRPAPPENLEGKNFHVSEKIDFYYDCGWWSGEVTKVLAGNRYIVRSNYHKIEREFNQFELRCHVEWINGRWVQDSSDVVTKHDLVHVTGNDQADLLPVHNTAVFATESNTRKQIIELPTLESDNTDISPPSEKSDKGEAIEGSLTVISHPKKVVPITPSQLKGLNDCPMPDLGVEKIGSVLDCDTFGRHETAVDLNLSALSNIEEEQCKLSKTQVQCLQMDLVVSSPQHCIKRQGEAKESSLFLTAHPEKAIPTTPSSSDRLVEHLAPNFGQESTLWNIEGEQRDLSKTQVEQRDLSIVQVECLDKSLVFQSPPVSIEVPDRQQCRRNGTRWRCSKMAVHGKLYCEKHLLERSLHNDKRRKTPRVLVIDQGPPSDQCRRSGTGWRCHEKVSPGKQHCEKHRLLLDRYNEKRRKRQSEQIHTSVNQSLLSDRQQCRRKGRGWRCPEMVSPGKRYCEKH